VRAMGSPLETERLQLRRWAESDVDGYRALVAERGEGMPDTAGIRGRIAAQAAGTARTGLALLAVIRRVEGDFIGYCGLIVGRASVEEPEIAYELNRVAHGHGYATEAARAVLDEAVATGRSRLWATVRSWNAASFRVLEKLGFSRDHVSVDEHGELVWLARPLP
jgi:RimJ/RimL family protein N-acetyltransferase